MMMMMGLQKRGSNVKQQQQQHGKFPMIRFPI
jgi:hypothetical protein